MRTLKIKMSGIKTHLATSDCIVADGDDERLNIAATHPLSIMVLRIDGSPAK
jgi:hypothetical protein